MQAICKSERPASGLVAIAYEVRPNRLKRRWFGGEIYIQSLSEGYQYAGEQRQKGPKK